MARFTADEDTLRAALIGYEQEHDRIVARIGELRQQLNGANIVAPASKKPSPAKRVLSAAARRRIGAAQKKRWAAVRSGKEPAAKKPSPKRKLSAEGRANIVAALKRRWAAKKRAANNPQK